MYFTSNLIGSLHCLRLLGWLGCEQALGQEEGHGGEKERELARRLGIGQSNYFGFAWFLGHSTANRSIPFPPGITAILPWMADVFSSCAVSYSGQVCFSLLLPALKA